MGLAHNPRSFADEKALLCVIVMTWFANTEVPQLYTFASMLCVDRMEVSRLQ